MKRGILEFLEQRPKWVLLSLSIGLGLLIGAIDYLVLLDVALSIFYLIPVAIATWFVGYRAGLVVSIFCAAAWFQADATAIQCGADPPLRYWNASVRFGFFLILSYLLSELKQAYRREQQLARLDGLTGANNRRFFMELLDAELARARRYQHPLTLAYLDLDDFKQVNDQLGHSAGDRLLQRVAQVLREGVRSHDSIARLGGDEFAVMLPQISFEQAQLALSRLHQQLQALSQSEHWPVGFSIGAATFLKLPDSVDTLISQTDHLMYGVKREGKNRLRCQQYV
ncbi:MAG: GGDEF domain-containing protein [Cyanobacteria bacterium Co-bin13]|nr:GGDEF domain-containing protein [Cyanobacteria bacterium Co-bin13]